MNTPSQAPQSLEQLLTLVGTGEDRFVAPVNEANIGGEIFGGQYLGQALSAALSTSGKRAPHAIKGWFLRQASASRTLTFQVHRVRDGRQFAHRRVVVTQDQKEVFHLDVSLRDTLEGPSHQLPKPQVTPSQDCASLAELAQRHGESLGGKMKAQFMAKQLIDLRPVISLNAVDEAHTEPFARTWVNVRQPNFSSPAYRYAALAYLTDYWANAASRALHCRTLFTHEVTSLSMNHDVWFHREPDLSEPLLFDLDSPATQGGTGLSRGLVYHRDGRLLASTAQEALILPMPAEASPATRS